MPFATIHHGSDEARDREQLSYAVEGSQSPRVVVHWSPGDCAQIGFTVDWGVLEELGRMRAAGQFGTDREHEFFTACLSRKDLNEAIKGLRRARDAVFEPDA